MKLPEQLNEGNHVIAVDKENYITFHLEFKTPEEAHENFKYQLKTYRELKKSVPHIRDLKYVIRIRWGQIMAMEEI